MSLLRCYDKIYSALLARSNNRAKLAVHMLNQSKQDAEAEGPTTSSHN